MKAMTGEADDEGGGGFRLCSGTPGSWSRSARRSPRPLCGTGSSARTGSSTREPLIVVLVKCHHESNRRKETRLVI